MAITYQMAGLQCACGDVFTASCDIEPTGCALAWLLLLLSVVAHAMHYCGVKRGKGGYKDPNSKSICIYMYLIIFMSDYRSC